MLQDFISYWQTTREIDKFSGLVSHLTYILSEAELLVIRIDYLHIDHNGLVAGLVIFFIDSLHKVTRFTHEKLV